MRPIVLGELMVHNDDELGVGGVRFIEKATPERRCADRLKVVADEL